MPGLPFQRQALGSVAPNPEFAARLVERGCTTIYGPKDVRRVAAGEAALKGLHLVRRSRVRPPRLPAKGG